MTLSDLFSVLVGLVQGVGAIAFFLLALFIGVCVVLTLVKFRSTRNTLIVKSLDELVGDPIRYLPPSAPRGQMDQLAGSRHSA